MKLSAEQITKFMSLEKVRLSKSKGRQNKSTCLTQLFSEIIVAY